MQTDTRRRLEWPTLVMLTSTYIIWASGTVIWADSAALSLLLTALATAQFSSLQHEVLHGHPFRNQTLNEALIFPGLLMWLPYQRFRDTHLAHHHDPNLTDPYDDPESNYHDPAVWARLPRWRQRLLRCNNTLLGRMTLGPFLGSVDFVIKDMALCRAGQSAVRRAWLWHGAGVALVAVWLIFVAQMPIWAYLVSNYLATALLKIRTFLEHRAHDAFRARTVVVEDRGPLALLFLNNNFHVVHHMHPSEPWYRLPAIYAARTQHYLRRNDDYRYPSYGAIFRRYFLTAKDPVPHPVWPVKKADTP